MSLKAEPIGPVPEETARLAHELRNEIDCDQALDFWNQTGKIECILLCRHSRLKDETDERSRIKCGRDLRPHHPCGVRSVTSRRIRLSSCWQDLRGSPFAPPAWIAVNRSCRKSERSNRFLLAEKRCVLMFPLPRS